MEYRLSGTGGMLVVRDIVYHEEESDFPNNTSLCASVACGSFSGEAHMEVGIDELRQFAASLMDVCQSMSGRTYIKEPYGESCIYIEPLFAGQIGVSGELFEKSVAMGVRFQFTVTQEELKKFAAPLWEGWGK